MNSLRTVAVVLAGGTGTRVGGEVPKQLLELGGRPILARAVEAFERAEQIDEVLVVMTPGHLQPARRLVAGSGKVSRVLPGGASRDASTRAALAALGDEDCRILLHDAARPLVSGRIIGDVVRALETYEAVTAAIPSADTIIAVEDATERAGGRGSQRRTSAGAGEPTPGTTERIPGTGEPTSRADDVALPDDAAGEVMAQSLPRERLRRLQTPQGFRLAVLREAYVQAGQDPGFAATDDASVVLRYLPGVPVAVVPGEERNLKITRPEDLAIAERLLERG